MRSSGASDSIGNRLRTLVEAYTPDGTGGRIALSAITGPIGAYSLLLAFGFLVNPWIGSIVFVPATAVLGTVLTITAILTLWPVYLSTIGRLDSPAAYHDEPDDQAEPSPVERLKASYRRGELSETEFERELEALLERSRTYDLETELERESDLVPSSRRR